MSTWVVGGAVGASLETVYAQVGGALQSTGAVELQVNQATTVVNDTGTTRQITKNEVLILLNIFEQYITKMNWPFAAS